MATREQVLGNWNELKGKIKEHWGQLTDNDLDQAKGNVDQLIGLIQKKTGKARGEIESFIDELSSGAGGAFAQATEKAREYVNQAGEAVWGTTDQVRERAMEGYEQAHDMVRRHPAEAVAVAFGTGLIVGAIVGLMCHSSR